MRTISKQDGQWTWPDGTTVDPSIFDSTDRLDVATSTLFVLDVDTVVAYLRQWPQAEVLADAAGMLDYTLRYDEIVPTQVALAAYKRVGAYQDVA